MMKRIQLFQSSTGVSPYMWALFAILPFYFIFQWSSTIEIVTGIILSIFFFILYRISFISHGWVKYVWTSFLIIISIIMTIYLDYVYFSFFLAYLIGNLKKWPAFITFYIIQLVGASIAINFNFVVQNELFLKQLPFVIIIWISIILLPFNIYNRKKREKLEAQLEFANKRISDLMVQEERQRIARDLHDTLGQKLSLIGLKSDLAGKIIAKDPKQARVELKDIQQTARTALKEVRLMVSDMRGIRLNEEMIQVEQILKAAEIKFVKEQEIALTNVPVFVENILSMCLKESVNNVVKHSKATKCRISIHQTVTEIVIAVSDNGKGIDSERYFDEGNGLIGMKERLEFVNGTLEMVSKNGTTVTIRVPNFVKQEEEETL
jgi:two-component system, NarL family, sensor histidine kinase DesK